MVLIDKEAVEIPYMLTFSLLSIKDKFNFGLNLWFENGGDNINFNTMIF